MAISSQPTTRSTSSSASGCSRSPRTTTAAGRPGRRRSIRRAWPRARRPAARRQRPRLQRDDAAAAQQRLDLLALLELLHPAPAAAGRRSARAPRASPSAAASTCGRAAPGSRRRSDRRVAKPGDPGPDDEPLAVARGDDDRLVAAVDDGGRERLALAADSAVGSQRSTPVKRPSPPAKSWRLLVVVADPSRRRGGRAPARGGRRRRRGGRRASGASRRPPVCSTPRRSESVPERDDACAPCPRRSARRRRRTSLGSQTVSPASSTPRWPSICGPRPTASATSVVRS